MAMEALGRLFNAVPIASGVPLSLRDAAGVTFVCTGSDTFTITSSATFAGSYTDPGNIIDHVYASTATDGTAGWTRTAVTPDNAAAGTGTTVIEVHGVSLPDGHVYVKCTASASGLVHALVHDLAYQRKPANLPKLSA